MTSMTKMTMTVSMQMMSIPMMMMVTTMRHFPADESEDVILSCNSRYLNLLTLTRPKSLEEHCEQNCIDEVMSIQSKTAAISNVALKLCQVIFCC